MMFTTTIAIALGVNRLQSQTNHVLSLPFPVLLVLCFLVLGIVAAATNEFRGRSHKDSSTQSTLDAFRNRRPTVLPPPLAPQTDEWQAETVPESRRTRPKWWRRRMPSRFRSISHRDFQETPASSFYIRDN
jgi:hypothetical protein